MQTFDDNDDYRGNNNDVDESATQVACPCGRSCVIRRNNRTNALPTFQIELYAGLLAVIASNKETPDYIQKGRTMNYKYRIYRPFVYRF